MHWVQGIRIALRDQDRGVIVDLELPAVNVSNLICACRVDFCSDSEGMCVGCAGSVSNICRARAVSAEINREDGRGSRSLNVREANMVCASESDAGGEDQDC